MKAKNIVKLIRGSPAGQYYFHSFGLLQPVNNIFPAFEIPHFIGKHRVAMNYGIGFFLRGERKHFPDLRCIVICPGGDGFGNRFDIEMFEQGKIHMVRNSGDGEMKVACFFAPASNLDEYEFHPEVDFDGGVEL